MRRLKPFFLLVGIVLLLVQISRSDTECQPKLLIFDGIKEGFSGLLADDPAFNSTAVCGLSPKTKISPGVPDDIKVPKHPLLSRMVNTQREIKRFSRNRRTRRDQRSMRLRRSLPYFLSSSQQSETVEHHLNSRILHSPIRKRKVMRYSRRVSSKGPSAKDKVWEQNMYSIETSLKNLQEGTSLVQRMSDGIGYKNETRSNRIFDNDEFEFPLLCNGNCMQNASLAIKNEHNLKVQMQREESEILNSNFATTRIKYPANQFLGNVRRVRSQRSSSYILRQKRQVAYQTRNKERINTRKRISGNRNRVISKRRRQTEEESSIVNVQLKYVVKTIVQQAVTITPVSNTKHTRRTITSRHTNRALHRPISRSFRRTSRRYVVRNHRRNRLSLATYIPSRRSKLTTAARRKVAENRRQRHSRNTIIRGIRVPTSHRQSKERRNVPVRQLISRNRVTASQGGRTSVLNNLRQSKQRRNVQQSISRDRATSFRFGTEDPANNENVPRYVVKRSLDKVNVFFPGISFNIEEKNCDINSENITNSPIHRVIYDKGPQKPLKEYDYLLIHLYNALRKPSFNGLPGAARALFMGAVCIMVSKMTSGRKNGIWEILPHPQVCM